MKPTLGKATWLVYTTAETYSFGFQSHTGWCWVAFGPRGSESGVEETADEAIAKGQAAAYLFNNPRVKS
jgi:hypothetical protein